LKNVSDPSTEPAPALLLMTPSHSLPYDAPYQPIPLGPDQADDDVEDRQPKFIADRDGLADFKVKWIHLLLGCTLLLPWNGPYSTALDCFTF
jgi:hypothetical protein